MCEINFNIFLFKPTYPRSLFFQPVIAGWNICTFLVRYFNIFLLTAFGIQCVFCIYNTS